MTHSTAAADSGPCTSEAWTKQPLLACTATAITLPALAPALPWGNGREKVRVTSLRLTLESSAMEKARPVRSRRGNSA